MHGSSSNAGHPSTYAYVPPLHEVHGYPSMGAPYVGTPSMTSNHYGHPSIGAPYVGTPSMASNHYGYPSMGTPYVGTPLTASSHHVHPSMDAPVQVTREELTQRLRNNREDLSSKINQVMNGQKLLLNSAMAHQRERLNKEINSTLSMQSEYSSIMQHTNNQQTSPF